MFTLEIAGKSLVNSSDRILIHVNAEPLQIVSKGRRLYVNGKRVNGWNLPVLELLGLGIVGSLWYTMLFTEYGYQFMDWIFG